MLWRSPHFNLWDIIHSSLSLGSGVGVGVGVGVLVGWNLQVSQLQTKMANDNPEDWGSQHGPGENCPSLPSLHHFLRSHLLSQSNLLPLFYVPWPGIEPNSLLVYRLTLQPTEPPGQGKPAPIINALKLINGRQPQSQRWIQAPGLLLTSFVNLGKALKCFETEFLHLPVEIGIHSLPYKFVGWGKGRNGSECGSVNQRVSAPTLTGYPGESHSWWEASPLPLRKPKREDIPLHSLAHRECQWPRLNSVLLPGSLNPDGVTHRPLALPGRVRRGVWSSLLVVPGAATVTV